MRVNVEFHGALGEELQATELEIDTPRDAVELIELRRPGVRRMVMSGRYTLVLQDKEDKGGGLTRVTSDNYTLPMSDEQLHFLPSGKGENLSGGATALLSLASLPFAATAAALGGYNSLIDWLTPGTPKPVGDENFVFDGPVNTTRQGNPVPVCYGGPIMVGSQVISVSMQAVELPLG